MKNLKFIVIIVIILFMMTCGISCNKQELLPSHTTVSTNTEIKDKEVVDPNIQTSGLFQTQFLMRDNNGNVIQHILLRSDTQELYIYDYFYDYDYRTGAYVFYDYKLTIKGIRESCKNEHHNKECECSCKKEEVITPGVNDKPIWSESNPPGTIWVHDNYIKVTQGVLKYDDFWNRWYFELTIENKSDHDIMVTTEDLSVNGYMYNNGLAGCIESVTSGNNCISKFSIYMDDMETLNISELEYCEFTLLIYDENDFNIIIEKDMYIVLKD